MSKKNVDDYLQEGMYGQKEIRPEERRRFLGTLRERIVLAITMSEVMKGKGHQQLAQLMRLHSKSKLLLNGNISYGLVRDYKDLAEKNKISYTFVTNKNAQTDIGVVLAYDYAVDIEDIFLPEEVKQEPVSTGKQSRISAFIESLINDFRK